MVETSNPPKTAVEISNQHTELQLSPDPAAVIYEGLRKQFDSQDGISQE